MRSNPSARASAMDFRMPGAMRSGWLCQMAGRQCRSTCVRPLTSQTARISRARAPPADDADALSGRRLFGIGRHGRFPVVMRQGRPSTALYLGQTIRGLSAGVRKSVVLALHELLGRFDGDRGITAVRVSADRHAEFLVQGGRHRRVRCGLREWPFSFMVSITPLSYRAWWS